MDWPIAVFRLLPNRTLVLETSITTQSLGVSFQRKDSYAFSSKSRAPSFLGLLSMNKVLSWLASIKNNPRVWELAVPVLLVVTVHFSRPWRWWLPLVGIAFAYLVPQKQFPQAQRVHFLFGYLATSVSRWYGLAIILPVAFFLERFFDPAYEGDPWRWGGIVDFASYAVGAGVGLI